MKNSKKNELYSLVVTFIYGIVIGIAITALFTNSDVNIPLNSTQEFYAQCFLNNATNKATAFYTNNNIKIPACVINNSIQIDTNNFTNVSISVYANKTTYYTIYNSD